MDNRSFACVQYAADETIRAQLHDQGGEGDPVGVGRHRRPRELVGTIGPAWRPSIFMPRWASRITLRIEAIRAEPLRSIGEADAKAEGATDTARVGYVNGFEAIWRSIHGPRSLASNPWVWVIEFRIAWSV